MADTRRRTGSPVSVALFLGWLIPGAGHLLTRHWVRALLLFLSITSLWWLGLAMDGHIFQPGGGDFFSLLGFVGDLGAGAYYLVGWLGGFGQSVTTTAVQDYGTKFIVVASLLNIIAAVDAHNLSIGRKPSGLVIAQAAAGTEVASYSAPTTTTTSGYTAGTPSAAAGTGPVQPRKTGEQL
jgi:hypothetical protein